MLRHMKKKRRVSLFRNGRNQAVRIPREWELEGKQAVMHREKGKLIIEPVPGTGLLELLSGMEPVDIPFPDVDRDLPPVEDVDL